MYTENKPLCRLFKMCNQFFYMFRVILSTNVFHLVCSTAIILTTEAVDQRVDPDRRLAHLAGGEGRGAMLFSDGSLPGCFVQVGAAKLQTNAKLSRVPLLSLWCSVCHVYAVNSEYKQCTEISGGPINPF
jgi:hypothetical protein